MQLFRKLINCSLCTKEDPVSTAKVQSQGMVGHTNIEIHEPEKQEE
jgi:hypothetical protein